jgi:hypothetical protein
MNLMPLSVGSRSVVAEEAKQWAKILDEEQVKQ